MKSALSVVALGALAGQAVATDVLFSKHMTKRSLGCASWNMSFFHVNDVHAHLDEFSSSGTDCTRPERGCYGGYARIKSTVDELREQHPKSLFLNAGDEFQGTLFYSFYGPEKIAETVNDLKFDAMTLGNHEWDGGDEELGRFLNNLTFPVTSCNVKSEYAGLKENIKNYVLFPEKKIAVIGATTPTTPGISSVGEKTKFLEPIAEIQKAIWEIRNTTDIKYIVALSHLGYPEDIKLAQKTEGLSLIIGGHSHTLLGDMPGAEGKYPTIEEDLNGNEVFIVTSYRWGEYVGSIELKFDEKSGRILGYRGAPIHLVNTTAQDTELQAKIDAWRGPFEEFASEVLGFTNVELDQTKCQTGDCLLGQVMADAMYEYRLNATTGDAQPDFAFINAGGVRATIDEGNITRGEVLTSFPFGNSIVELTLTGAQLVEIFEGAVSRVNQANGQAVTSWFQLSRNIVVQYNPDFEVGSRLVSVFIGGEDLNEEATYRIVTLDFLAGGGDNFFTPTRDIITLDTQDEVLVQYISARSPIDVELEERVVAVEEALKA